MMTEAAAKSEQIRGFLPSALFGRRRGWLIAALCLLFLAVFAALAWMVWRYELSETQADYDRELKRVVGSARAQLLADLRALQMSGVVEQPQAVLLPVIRPLASTRSSVLVVEMYRQPGQAVVTRLYARPTPEAAAVTNMPLAAESIAAAAVAQRRSEVAFGASLFMAVPDRPGQEVIDAWVPFQVDGNSNATAMLRVVFRLSDLLSDWLPRDFTSRNEVSIREADGTVLAWGPGLTRGAGTFRSTAILDLPGNPLVLHANNESAGPRLIPNALYGLVLLLGLTLLGSFIMLFRDIRSRLVAEARLREALSFRTAMENSLITGLRARALDGRITYVNQAFCDMVGFTSEEIVNRAQPMPYWAPEERHEYERRHAQVIAGTITAEGFETIFMHKNGKRFPVLVYEAPLIDQNGSHAGWMGSIVDMTRQREVEQLNLQQQEQLERASRLSTMGELASVLSHELNQPLSAISSYASGAENLLQGQGRQPELQLALQTIQRQAQRAGAIIHRMQDFVRKREIQSEMVDLTAATRALEPLVLMQARSCGARVMFDWPSLELWVQADRVLLEQVVLNLSRNAIEAVMDLPLPRRQIRLRLQRADTKLQAVLTVDDAGQGVDPDVLPQLFTMYVTTKNAGMGIGLNICRSVAERFGGQVRYQVSDMGGASFVFSIPLAQLAHEWPNRPVD
jgi:two-component system, LuxR family, sensor histidine kinase DctS